MAAYCKFTPIYSKQSYFHNPVKNLVSVFPDKEVVEFEFLLLL